VLFLLLVTLGAHAGKCTPEQAVSAPADGTVVQISGIEKPDPYFKSRGALIGREGRALGMTQLGPCDFAGSVELDDGGSPYFTRVRLVPMSSDACPEGAVTELQPGQEVRFLAVHSDDAYFDSRSDIEGTQAIATAPDQTDGCWWGGEFTSSSGDRDFYFYKVAVAPTGEGVAPAPVACPAGALRQIGEGDRLRLAALHPDDAYYSTGDAMLGSEITSLSLHVTEDCWFAGEVSASDGSTSYFYKAAFVPVDGATPSLDVPGTSSCPDGAIRGRDVLAGTPLQLVALHSEDAYSTSDFTMPMTGQAAGDGLTVTEDCWYGGSFSAADGSSYYFYKAAFTAGSDAPPTPSACPNGALSSVEAGSTVRVLKVHPDDAYFSDRARIEGRVGVAPAAMELESECFFSGEFMIGDEALYFYKAALGAP
jgi:hypothetical protein